jgi:replication factor A1
VVVLEDGASPAGGFVDDAGDDGGGDDATDEGGDTAGLDAFGDSGSGTGGASTDGGSAATADADGGTGDAERVEFTGTVVQTGDPVVLDDGERTMTVETGETVRLGQEVTVRGEVGDGDRVDADDVF